jgi:hypothetical protein
MEKERERDMERGTGADVRAPQDAVTDRGEAK